MPSLIERHYDEIWETYDSMVRTVMRDHKALDIKTKELIAIVISIINRCETCIEYHVNRAMDSGASEEEVVEAISVLMVMRGFSEEVWSRKIVIKSIRSWQKSHSQSNLSEVE